MFLVFKTYVLLLSVRCTVQVSNKSTSCPPVQRSPEVQDTIGISLVPCTAYLPCAVYYSTQLQSTGYSVQRTVIQHKMLDTFYGCRLVRFVGRTAVRPGWCCNRERAVACGHLTPVKVLRRPKRRAPVGDRKSTRLNSSHALTSRMPSSA